MCFALIHTVEVLDISFGASHYIIHNCLICCEVCAFYLEECRQEEFQQSTSWHSNYYWNKFKTGISGSPTTSVYSSPHPVCYLICRVHKDAYYRCQLAYDEDVSDTICTWLYLYPKMFITDSNRKITDSINNSVDRL